VTITESNPLNGVDIDATLAARTAMTEQPAAAVFQWRSTTDWVSGTHSTTTVEDFFGAGGEQNHRQPFVYDTDHPEIFSAADKGATPTEIVLVALAGCLTAGVASVAANRGIRLRAVRATITGDMDLQGILGIDPDVRNGFSNIAVRYEIDADASPEEIRAVVAQSQKRSAVFDVITNPTNVVVEVA
jgi:uncharacterized OsmC-like protein